MLDEILAISGNRAVYEALGEHLSNEKAVAFVGAGASAGMYPLWGALIEQLADYAVAQGKAEVADAERWKRDKSSTAQQRVRNILRKLDEPLYFQFLRQTFSERRGSDGKRFTAIHAALMRLQFRGYVTTNYDPALDFARAEIRPACLTTGIPTWQDDDEVYRWLTGEIFDAPDTCPILWLHGSWQRPSGVVLNAGEYSNAYKPGIYRNTFRKLWEQDRLVFVGFGFNDQQFTFMVGEILREIAGAHPVPRHIAILGVGTDVDDAAISELRAGLEEDYHVRPLFYRVREDHRELQEILDSLSRAPTPVPTPFKPRPQTGFIAHWRHETTDDARFTGRQEEQARLDRWVRDEAVRVIGIAAVGGTGKTALVAHWLKETEGSKSRSFAGLFAWSFYRERDTGVFLDELLVWAQGALGVRFSGSGSAIAAVVALLRKVPLVLVLDGLEVLQEGPDDPRHGAFLDGALRELLVSICSRQHHGLAVLTSRFIFADLEQFAGTAFHQLDLPGLTPPQGAALLSDLEVGGSNEEREEISERLEGHPLGLRVFAEAIPDSRRYEPLTFVDEAFAEVGLTRESALTAKVRRLLVFYEERLPSVQVRLLSAVAIFRAPVAAERVINVVRELGGGEDLPDDASLHTQLTSLRTRGLLTSDLIDRCQHYACHPILRDHFRGILLGGGRETVHRAAELLAGQPSDEWPQSIQELDPLLLSIELLLDAGEVQAAYDIVRGPLKSGAVFKWVAAMSEGVRTMTSFFQDNARRSLVESILPPRDVGVLLHSAALLASMNGRLVDAVSLFEEAEAIFDDNSQIALRHMSLDSEVNNSIYLGRLSEALARGYTSLTEATRLSTILPSTTSWASLASALSLSGRPVSAAEGFAIANELEKKDRSLELYSFRGVRWADFLLATGHEEIANKLTLSNLDICDQYHWNNDRARCHSVLSVCALADGRNDDAKAHIREAEAIFQRGQLLYELGMLHARAGQIALAENDQDTALERAAEALALAQPRGMRLIHADALVLRGRARMIGKNSDPARAFDDAEDALRIARDCGYAWAERDALMLIADSAPTRADADRARAEAAALSARLTLTDEDLRQAEVKAAAWLADWEKKRRT